MTFSEQKKFWRIFLPVYVFSILFGSISCFAGFHFSQFFNFWIGAVAGSFLGYVLGIVWQFKSGQERSKLRKMAIKSGLGYLLAFGFLFGFLLPRMQGEIRRLEELAVLNEQTITQIIAKSTMGNKKSLLITDQEVIHSFSRRIGDSVGYMVNHEQYSHSWYVVLEGDTRREFKLSFSPKYPKSVIGEFIKKKGNRTTSFGNFRSEELRGWVEENLFSLSQWD